MFVCNLSTDRIDGGLPPRQLIGKISSKKTCNQKYEQGSKIKSIPKLFNDSSVICFGDDDKSQKCTRPGDSGKFIKLS